MNQITLFFKENYVSIAVIVSVIFALLIIISIREWNLNPPKPDSKLVQSVTVETFSSGVYDEKAILKTNIMQEIQSLNLSPTDSFCRSHLGNSAELQKSCSQLTNDGCAQTKCCILSEGKCVAGSAKHGPTFHKPRGPT
jgi:predicted negative regulator of RcsB-dependent stress response